MLSPYLGVIYGHYTARDVWSHMGRGSENLDPFVESQSPAYVMSILAHTNLFAAGRAYVRNNIRRCAKMHGSCMKIF